MQWCGYGGHKSSCEGERTREQAKGRGYSPPVNVVAVSGWRSGGVVRVRMV